MLSFRGLITDFIASKTTTGYRRGVVKGINIYKTHYLTSY